MFLLVPAHPGSPGQRAVKQLLLLLLLSVWRIRCYSNPCRLLAFLFSEFCSIGQFFPRSCLGFGMPGGRRSRFCEPVA